MHNGAPGKARFAPDTVLASLAMRFLSLLALATTLMGCPTNADKGPAKLPPCAKFGDNCEFAPGKLGSCVEKDGCTSGGTECFVCQSQH